MYYNTPEQREEQRRRMRPRSESLNRMAAPMFHDQAAAGPVVVDLDEEQPKPTGDTLSSKPRRKHLPPRSAAPRSGRLEFAEPAKSPSSKPLPLERTSSMLSDGPVSPLSRRESVASFRGSPGGGAPAGGSFRRGGAATPPSGPAYDDPEAARVMSEDMDAITAQLVERETMHASDVLEQLMDDLDNGFNEELFAACKKYVSGSREYDRLHGTDYCATVLEAHEVDDREREVAHELTVYDTLPWHRKTRIFLEFPDSGRGAKVFYIVLSLVVIGACLCTMLETLPEYNPIVRPSYGILWTATDWVFTAFLTVETVMRFIVTVLDDRFSSKTQNVLGFFRRPGNIADIVALMPTYIQPFLDSRGRVLTGSLRTARLLRLLKFLRRYMAIRRLMKAMQRSVPYLVSPFCFLGMSLLLLSSTVYYAERGEYHRETAQFRIQDPQCLSEPLGFLNASYTCPYVESKYVSMFQAMWWGMVTMSTVGYGDFVPITTWGKLVGAVTMVSGVAFMAMPIAVIGNNYMQVIAESTNQKSRTVEDTVLKKAAETADSRLVMPGEALVNIVRRVLPDTTVDLRAPTPEALYLIDAALESALKELVNADCIANNEQPPFPAAGAVSGRVAVWMASVINDLDNTGGESPVTPRRSRRKAQVLHECALSRPSVLTVGCAPGGGGQVPQAALTSPDVVIYSADLHRHFTEKVHERDVRRRKEDELRRQGFAPEGMSTPQRVLAPFAVSHHHATLVLTRVWGETLTLLIPTAGALVSVNGKEVASHGVRKLEAAARGHLVQLAQVHADKLLNKHTGTSAFAQRMREQTQETLERELQLDSAQARFRFAHERLKHWSDMEAVPVLLQHADVVQFGAPTVVSLPSESERRVQGAPVGGETVVLSYRYEDNSTSA